MLQVHAPHLLLVEGAGAAPAENDGLIAGFVRNAVALNVSGDLLVPVGAGLTVGEGRGMPVPERAIDEDEGAGVEASMPPTIPWSRNATSRAVIRSPGTMIIRRSTRFRSSRTLPGHG